MEPRNTRKNQEVKDAFLFGELTEEVVQAAYSVHASLGSGFLEKVYETAFAHELGIREIPFQQQHPIEIFYKNATAGMYIADFLIDDKVIVEVKAVNELNQIHTAQLMNYLKATSKRVGLLINFGAAKVNIKRVSL